MEYDPEKTICRNVYVSSRQRNTSLFPSAARFDIDLPVTIKYVHGVNVRNYKFSPEMLVNGNNQTFAINVDGTTPATVRLAKGDYSNDITTLLTALNTAFTTYQITFSVNTTTNKVQLTFSGAYVTNYILIPYNSLLAALGYTTGICLYRTGNAPSPIPTGYTGYDTTAAAPNAYEIVNDGDLVLRIVDLEALYAADSVSNRATAVLPATREVRGMVASCPDTYYELNQVQARLQKLRISVFNTAGAAYDIDSSGLSFIIEFHCFAERSCMSF